MRSQAIVNCARPGACLRYTWLLVGALLAAVGLMLTVSAKASAENCSLADLGYNAACGPEYESPGWGDAGGWTDPSQYSTIKLADITGNGQAELLARNSDGLEIWRFDTSVGQWRPAIGANGLPEVLTDFRSPLPSESPNSDGADPMVYSTIQAAQVLGNGTESIVAQFPDGTHTYDYVAPAGTRSIDGGKWLEEPVSGPKGDLPPSVYLNMQVIGVQPNVTPATLVYQDGFYVHSGPGTPGGGSWDGTGKPTLAPETSDPRYYLDNRAALWPVLHSNGGPPHSPAAKLTPVDIYRTSNGVGWQVYDPGQNVCGFYGSDVSCTEPGTGQILVPWTGVPGAFGPPGPFADNASPSFGDDPSFYETLQVANDLRGPGDNDGYVLGRLADGLHVYASGNGEGWDDSIPVLTALKDPSPGDSSPGIAPQPSEWSSIRTGDVTGDGRTDVLALVDGQLRAWELKPNGSGGWAWSELPAAVPLDLGQMFESNASYYSTIQVGPVAGPGYPDGVIARGPFGIRTWFYCTGGASPVPGCASLGGQSGWTSFLPQGTGSYPQFSGGQAAAWTALNALAHSPSDPLIAPSQATVRDVWTATNAPSTDQLATLASGLVQAAGCSGQTSTSPPVYSACQPPANSSGFSAADWTAVVNETLADVFYAQQIADYYNTLGNLRRDIFLAEGAALPAVGNVVKGLLPAAGNSTEISPQAMWSTVFGVGGAVAGVLAAENPEVAAALAITSYLLALIPSATPDMTAPPFYGTFADLQNRFAAAVGEADKAQEEQSYEVRQNWGLMRLVGQLTGPTGPWHTLDAVGIKSAAEEGYVLYLYKQLLPTVYDRYIINKCATNRNYSCSVASWRGLIGSAPDFQTLGLPPDNSGPNPTDWTPCGTTLVEGAFRICNYTTPPPEDVATQVWGPVQDTCSYNGNPATAWTYGDPTSDQPACNLGVNPDLSIAFNPLAPPTGWNFTTCSGTPWVFISSDENDCRAPGVATAGTQGSVQLTLTTTLPSDFDVSSATLPAGQVLSQTGAAGGLLSAPPPKGKTAQVASARLGTIHLTSTKGQALGGAAGLLQGQGPGGPSAALIIKTRGGAPSQRLATLRLQLSGVQVATPRACLQLPATVTLASPTFTLNTTLQLSNGHSTVTISRPTQWRCVLNRGGTVTTLRTVTPQAPAQRPGLTLSIAGPRELTPGSRATYTVRMGNTRRGPSNREISSIWDIAVAASLTTPADARLAGRTSAPMIRRVAELRRGHATILRIPVTIPAALRNSSGHSACLSIAAIAPSTRSANARTCAAIGTLPPGRG